jgi:hypothetical protein
MEQTNKTYDYLLDNELFTKAELDLITSINGYNLETLNDAIYSRYGFRNIEQLQEEQDQ